MHIRIRKGQLSDLFDCAKCLDHSELGRRYFPKEENKLGTLTEGIKKEQLYVATNTLGEITGFVWLIKNGMFHSFPYIHIVAVKEELRGNGIGHTLLQFAEQLAFLDSNRLFLLVGDFNPAARQLYESIGYKMITEFKDLYRDGITEQLMEKQKNKIKND